MGTFNSGLPNQPDKVLSAGAPAYVTPITVAGSGTFVPRATTKWMKVTLVPGGGGGAALAASASGYAAGGQAGVPFSVWVQRTAASYPYTVGSGGTAGNSATPLAGGDGGNTIFGGFTAYGGKGGYSASGTSNNYFDPRGGSNGFGNGGGPAAGAPNGFGAGGGGAVGAGANGAAGAGGLLIIEEY